MLDDRDPRSKGLLHLIVLLSILKTPPKYVFLENVPNFERSRCREKLVQQLCSLNYKIQEFLLSPLQFGIPNNRLRYYLAAQQQSLPLASQDYLNHAIIHTAWPLEPPIKNSHSSSASQHISDVPPLQIFLEDRISNDLAKYLVPSKYLLKSYNFRFDIVRPEFIKSSCFTKAYGSHHIYTSGSLLQDQHLEIAEYDFTNPESLTKLGLRFFTPLEIARLHAFPVAWPDLAGRTSEEFSGKATVDQLADGVQHMRHLFHPELLAHGQKNYFEFPDDMPTIQQYRLLGNSLNVWVVAELFRCILFSETSAVSLATASRQHL